MSVANPASPHDTVQFANVDYDGKTLPIEYTWISPQNPGPLIVFLHEGLGSRQMWRSFPHTLCQAVGCRGLVYSRTGYGKSAPLWPDRHWPVDFMHVEARELLPRLLSALDIDARLNPPVLLGHSDGASIALIYAYLYPDKISRLIAIAPHIRVEDITVVSIANTRQAFMGTDLPQRLNKYHRDVDYTFWGWANVWLDPKFLTWNIESLLPALTCATLAVQGYDDHYGTMRQIDGIEALAPNARVVKFENCGHSPHIDQPAALIRVVTDFLLSP